MPDNQFGRFHKRNCCRNVILHPFHHALIDNTKYVTHFDGLEKRQTVFWTNLSKLNVKFLSATDGGCSQTPNSYNWWWKLTLRCWRCWWGRGRVLRALPSWKREWNHASTPPKNIMEDCCALFPQNEIVEFLDQCSCYLRVSGSVALIFEKSILSLWLTLFWPSSIGSKIQS